MSEVIFSRGGARPPRLDGLGLVAHRIEEFLVAYDNYVKKVEQESGDGVERRPAVIMELVSLAQQDMLSVRYFKGAEITNDTLREGLERAAGLKDEVNRGNLQRDLSRILRMSESRSIRDNVSVVAVVLFQYLR